MSVGTAPAIDALVAAVRSACSGGGDACRAAVGRALSERLDAGLRLPPELLRTEADSYCSRVLHIDEQGRFTIRVMTWRPGQVTPIHDHIAWCVVGMVEGEETEDRYRLVTDGQQQRLEPLGADVMHRGDISLHEPGAHDIHRVSCTSSGPAASLHVYGTVVPEDCSSIGATYDHLPVAGPPA